MERIRKQINNFNIRSTTKGKIQVFAPNKEMIAEYDNLDDAINFTKNNKKYKHKKKEKVKKEKVKKEKVKKEKLVTWKLDSIDILCERVNEKYKLKNREIGSIEHYSSTTENLIVQIGNDTGGFIPLMSGTNKDLVKFLMNLLNGYTVLQVDK